MVSNFDGLVLTQGLLCSYGCVSGFSAGSGGSGRSAVELAEMEFEAPLSQFDTQMAENGSPVGLDPLNTKEIDVSGSSNSAT